MARSRAKDHEHKERAWQAWQTASLTAYAYHKPKKMPSLDSLTAERPKAAIKAQTPAQIEAGLKRMFGLKRSEPWDKARG